MPVIDLTAGERPAARNPVLDAPRRVGLSLPELKLAAHLAGDSPLPFTSAPAPRTRAMESRLGGTPAQSDDAAFRALQSSRTNFPLTVRTTQN